jgi:O-antigen/teichoic acid export membrane protein
MTFSEEILSLWTRNSELAFATHFAASALVMGVTMHVLLNTLDSMQMAYAYMRPALVGRVLTLAVFVPLLILLSRQLGLLGAAVAWIVAWAIYGIIVSNMVFHGILRAEKWKWCVVDLLIPAFAAYLSVALLRYSFQLPSDALALLAVLALFWAVSFGVTALASPEGRRLAARILGGGGSMESGA